MRVTIGELLKNGAKISPSYIGKLTTAVGYTPKNGYLESLFETSMIRKAIESREYCIKTSESTSTSNRGRFASKTKSIIKAINKMEKTNGLSCC